MVEAPRVLIVNVDDYEPARYARTQILCQAGFQVKEASTGNDALRLAASEHPAVILLDVNLPDMSGFEVCRRLKADPATSLVPILHLSATFVNAVYLALGLEGGADGYLTEPVEPPVLIATVNALLRMRRTEDALRAAARRWQTTFDAISEGIAILNTSGTILQCNEAFLRIFGRPPSEIVGRPIWELWDFPPERMEQLSFWRLLKNRQRQTLDLSFGDRWFQVTVDPVEDDGLFIGAVYIVSDINERKRAEEERVVLLAREQTARAEAEAANRAKDEFLATLSHELRTPLQSMVGWTRLLRTGMLDEAARDHALEVLERNIKLQAQLIEDLLDVSRIIAGALRLEARPVDLVEVVTAAIDSVRPVAEAKGVRLEADLAGGVGSLLGDPARLQQVVWNLLSNAVKFTPPGGSVEVRLARAESQIHLTVTDTGQGIGPEFLPYVFDRFRQAESTPSRSHGGLGLGLAIARHLVELHGGTVRADSRGPGRGATFTVSLPLRAVGLGGDTWSAAPTENDPFQSVTTLEGVNVLVVDDEEDAGVLLTTVLEQCGARIAVASSVSAALEAVERLRPDVLVSDIGIPGEDGYTLIKRVRALAPEQGGSIPAVALTGYARPEDAVEALRAGFQVHLPKPVEPADLVRMVAQLVRRPRKP
ncbi:MAG TPA: response regulator [Methylomirabilota bacterium]|nr:response regulator [Methylomirabilota bacterium]